MKLVARFWFPISGNKYSLRIKLIIPWRFSPIFDIWMEFCTNMVPGNETIFRPRNTKKYGRAGQHWTGTVDWLAYNIRTVPPMQYDIWTLATLSSSFVSSTVNTSSYETSNDNLHWNRNLHRRFHSRQVYLLCPPVRELWSLITLDSCGVDKVSSRLLHHGNAK